MNSFDFPETATKGQTPASNLPRVSPADQSLVRVRPRLDAIDLLRGLVMIVMVLDHTRDFLGGSSPYPRDVQDSALFLTRWITHFCAPIFMFLAGISAFLYGSRGRARGEVSRYLLTRGLWLVMIEFIVIKFATTFSVRPDFFTLQVIWAIGCTMIGLSALIYLPRWGIAMFAVAVIGGHNLLDAVKPEMLGSVSWIWNVLHAPVRLTPLPGLTVSVLYPLIPWVGVLAAGYAFGPILLLERAARRNVALALGVGAIALFLVLRGSRGYGDPAARVGYPTILPTVLSYLNCEKYPPSLQYLLMTLGPALLVLGVVGEVRGKVGAWIVTFGRVPMFYYVAHLFVVHALAVIYVLCAGENASWLFGGKPVLAKPAGYGLSLPWVYVVWVAVVFGLYPACRWFAALKQRRREWWLSYL